MKRIVSSLMIVGLAICSGFWPSVGAAALELERIENGGVVKWQTDQTFLVTEINPSEGDLKMVYTDVAKTGKRVSNANVVWEKQIGLGDVMIPQLGIDRPDWAQTAFNRVVKGTAVFMSGYEQTFAAPEIDLTENTSGVLYYYIEINHAVADSVYGRADYSMCLNSELYHEGVSCRLERTADGGLTYYPYYNNERLEKIVENNDDEEISEQPVVDQALTVQAVEPQTEKVASQQLKNGQMTETKQESTEQQKMEFGQQALSGDNGEMRVPELGESMDENKNGWIWAGLMLGTVLAMLGLLIICWKRREKKAKRGNVL